jgi:hypothetical protein
MGINNSNIYKSIFVNFDKDKLGVIKLEELENSELCCKFDFPHISLPALYHVINI